MYRYSISSRLALAWASVLLGGLLAAGSLLYEGRPGRLPGDAVALVGAQSIGRAQWLRAVQAVEGDLGRPLEASERRAVLDKLIDEELLFQHALDSGLARDEPGLRKTLIAALIDASTAGGQVDEAGARALFAADPGRFAAQPRLTVAAVQAPGDANRAALLAMLRGKQAAPPGWQAVALPEQALSLSQLAHYLGGGASEALRQAAVDELIGPLQTGTRTQFLLVLARQADAPAYEDVAEAVRAEWARREAERALAALLQRLRRNASLRVSDAL
ncbi:MAG: hypothetical protein EPO48_16100 [Nevskiaceae bacterium]|nr:MAG: hypothetical protein EPO48_16100 [Nevskiaceae bacterium]